MSETKHKSNKKPAEVMLEKITVNAGVGKLSQNPNFTEKVLPQIERDLATIAGQKFKHCLAKKSIAGFKIREGVLVGLSTTLRRKKMVDFLERLITMVMPRIRDFRGIDPKNVDQHGVLNLGFKEQFVFPEINPEESFTGFSLGINVVPKTKKLEEAMNIYHKLNIPFKK